MRPDPYRVLQLSPGASLTDVKRAYRRLVKESHPDAAGPRGVARFLAVQAAYHAIIEAYRRSERLADARGGDGRASGSRPTATQPAWARSPHGGRRDAAEPGPSRARRPDETGESSEERARRRKARLGTTSYDDATPFEPMWEGASWYGEASGTYWTINPHEYADPRKHGPEYLARARAARAAGMELPQDEPAADGAPEAVPDEEE